ncbi:Uma2 family endonuclease [Streptomyces olivochromogenes]|uniref:Uma2 family endonuclease n=1 Tax=Streptomyces olivochromogenes TaxID=1963 RepID=UPI001F42E765|nr:Uma2 family endonuclease [Streptomyces olivochromogenes]MCF3129598.1 Uma2 family endonuclease [Streptomyces olivochromogenes]
MIKFLEEFEPPEGVRVELLRGEIVMSRSPDLVHNRIVMFLANQIRREPWSRLQTQCVDMLDAVSAPVPDLVVFERGTAPDRGWLIPARVTTVLVEVVSPTSVERDYGVKRSIYAAAQVPAYLIIDPFMAQCVLLTEPTGSRDDADYRCRRITRFGDRTPLEPLGIEVETSEFGIYENIRPHRYP